MRNLAFTIEEKIVTDDIRLLLNANLKQSIEITKNDKYVSLNGSIEFTGNAVTFDDESIEVKKTFPVDITIPTKRIADLDDLHMIIRGMRHDLEYTTTITVIHLEVNLEITGILEDIMTK
jgi:hypothetical protein